MTGRDDAEVVRGLEEVTPSPSAVTIGNFDGVHRGHQTLLRRAVDAGHRLGVRSVAVTFDPHPAAVVRPDRVPEPLQTLDDRLDALRATGVDLVVVLPFTKEVAALEPVEFVRWVLVERLRAARVVVGTNFRFGRGAAGDVVTLVEEGDLHDFEVEAVALVELDGVAVSSSAIRAHLDAGDVEWATRALGRPHRVQGTVVPGDGRGRTIGVPTANLELGSSVLVPAVGVYAGHAVVAGEQHPCVVNVGTRPTFGDGQAVHVEAHLLDVEVDVYGASLTVAFEHRLREEQRFDGIDQLVAQIQRDIDRARELLGA